MDHHDLDVFPPPRELSPLYVNEPWIIDSTVMSQITLPDDEPDNIRIYVPLDLNKEAILRRLISIKSKYGYVDWRNESDIKVDVALLIHQIEIYDQVHFVRHMPKPMTNPAEKVHSIQATSLVEEFIKELEGIESSGDTFPYEEIEMLREEFNL